MNFKRFYLQYLSEAAEIQGFDLDKFNDKLSDSTYITKLEDLKNKLDKDSHKVFNLLVDIQTEQTVSNIDFRNCIIKRGVFKDCTFGHCIILVTKLDYEKSLRFENPGQAETNYLIFSINEEKDKFTKMLDENKVEYKSDYSYPFSNGKKFNLNRIEGISVKRKKEFPSKLLDEFKKYKVGGAVNIKIDPEDTPEERKENLATAKTSVKFKSDAERMISEFEIAEIYTEENQTDLAELTDISNAILINVKYDMGGRLTNCIIINCELSNGTAKNSFIYPKIVDGDIKIDSGSFKFEDNCWVRVVALDDFKKDKDFIDYLGFKGIIKDIVYDFNPLTSIELKDELKDKVKNLPADIKGFYVTTDKILKFIETSTSFNIAKEPGVKFKLDNRVWMNGVCKDGILENIVWKDGLFKNGILRNSEWLNGVFFNGAIEKTRIENGSFEGGIILNCKFESGTVDDSRNGRIVWIQTEFDNPKVGWTGGIWKGGYIYDPNKDGNIESGAVSIEVNWTGGKFGTKAITPIQLLKDYNGTYLYSTKNPEEYWKNTRIKDESLASKEGSQIKVWKGGTFPGGVLVNTAFNEGIIENGLIINSRIKNAKIKNGIFITGTIDGANIENILWIDGEWKSGAWNPKGKTWIYDPHLEGNYEKIGQENLDFKQIADYLKRGSKTELDNLRTKYDIKNMQEVTDLANAISTGAKKVTDIPANLKNIFYKISGKSKDLEIAWKVEDVSNIFKDQINIIKASKTIKNKERILAVLNEYQRDIRGKCVLSPINPAEYWKGVLRPKDRKSLLSRVMSIAKTQLPDLTGGAGKNIENIKKQVSQAINIWKNKEVEPQPEQKETEKK